MLKIRLSQVGKKHKREYRLVVADKRSKRDGRAVSILGFWDPQSRQKVIDKKELNKWLAKGAQLSEGARKIVGHI